MKSFFGFSSTSSGKFNLRLLLILNVFKHDPDYEENEQKYGAIKTELLGDDSGKTSKYKCSEEENLLPALWGSELDLKYHVRW